MKNKHGPIPVNAMADGAGAGIAIERMSFNEQIISEGAEQSHRHDAHSFFLLEKGTIFIEIDFENYGITAPSLIYIHPNQVHRTTTSGDITVSSWSVTDEQLNPEYRAILEDLTPAKPLLLQNETFALFAEAVSLSIKFAVRKNDKLYQPLLKDSCNALVALAASLYLETTRVTGRITRFETVSKDFKKLLERHYITDKAPAQYAEKLNITAAYLNECVKAATGNSVTFQIQQRVILEAKRLLFYSNRSVKEIAADLGYDDYPYFSRLFNKVTGITALTFRIKNRV